MAIMDKRTTFALDEATIKSLKHLAALWNVSQAEAVRRALSRAEQEAEREQAGVLERLRAYHAAGRLSAAKAAAYLEEVAEGRADWGRSS
jgi:hypothetical protein